MTLKNGLFILAIIAGILGAAYSLHLRKRLDNSYKAIRELQTKQKVLVHKDRLKVAQNLSDSLREVINSFEPDTIFKTKIIVKHDTVTQRVLDSTYIYQLQYLRSELDRLYDSE
jgi:hypothetical protein